MLEKELQSILHEEIPLTRSMGLSVNTVDTNRVILTAPLEPNINHKCTAFGGSLYSVAVLCGWSLIYSRLHDLQLHSGHIVIQSSEVNYLLPVDGTIRAICTLQDPEAFDKFTKIYKRKKIARIELNTQIVFQEKIALDFTGQYVVHY